MKYKALYGQDQLNVGGRVFTVTDGVLDLPFPVSDAQIRSAGFIPLAEFEAAEAEKFTASKPAKKATE